MKKETPNAPVCDSQLPLTPEQARVLKERGTEAPFTGKYLHNKKKGEYTCAACGNVLFMSDTKFDSGTGWPSFSDVAKKGAVVLKDDNSHGMRRVEAVCAKCNGHLGHVFDDGPTPTGKRYCINSLALGFTEKTGNGKEETTEKKTRETKNKTKK